MTLLFVVAKLPGVHTGVQQATTNWWYGHNVLGLWFTPVSVGAIYYFLPKIIGRPVRSRTTCRSWASGRWPSSTARSAATT